MKPWGALIIFLGTLAAQSGGRPSESADCAQVDITRTALRRINDSDWSQISTAKLRSIWPMRLESADCAAGSCNTLQREDRIIQNECQCCEIFHFDVEHDDKGTATKQRLHTIVLYYSGAGRQEVMSAAKTLAQALGLSGSDLEAIGHKPVQSFNWIVDRNGRKEIALLEMRSVHRQETWTVYFHLSRQHRQDR